MNGEEFLHTTNRGECPQAIPDVVVSGATEESSKSLDIVSLRRKKIRDLVIESLQIPAAEEALLGATNGVLLKMVFRLGQAIGDVLKECSSPLDFMEVQTRGADMILRLVRQVERFTTLRHLLSAERQNLTLPKPR